MTAPTLTITVDRTGMAGDPDPLVLLGHDGSSNSILGVTGYREPAQQVRLRTAPASDFIHGEVALGWSWQQSLLQFEVAPIDATEATGRSAIAELRAAISRLQFEVTVEVGLAPAQTWMCDAGSVLPFADRSYIDLANADPKWSVSIPCYPIPTEA